MGGSATSLSRVKAESSTWAPPDCFAWECKNVGVRHHSFGYVNPLLARGDSVVGGTTKKHGTGSYGRQRGNEPATGEGALLNGLGGNGGQPASDWREGSINGLGDYGGQQASYSIEPARPSVDYIGMLLLMVKMVDITSHSVFVDRCLNCS